MSWSIALRGTQAEALAAIAADPQIDPSVAVAVKNTLCAFDLTSVVSLRTHGHVNDSGRGNALIQIDTEPHQPKAPPADAPAEPDPPVPAPADIAAEDAARTAAFADAPDAPPAVADATADEPDAPKKPKRKRKKVKS